MDLTRPRLWESVLDIVHIKPLVVVGTSLRDPSVVRLFEEARPGAQLGYLVVRSFSKTTEARVKRWNLECIAADADVSLPHLQTAWEARHGRWFAFRVLGRFV
jgi:hypothetical protein